MTAQHTEDHGLLRFLTCGSVDDGKSTLIGRLLFDTKTSERQGRVIDHDAAASMEKKKQEGYF